MKNKETPRLRAAQRARERPDFLGWVLARFLEDERINERNLNKRLGASAENWVSLQLCLRPRPDYFLADVSAIAAACQVDRDTLAAIVRRVEATQVLSDSGPPAKSDLPRPVTTLDSEKATRQAKSAGSLLAARSRKKRHSKKDSGRGGNGS